MADTAVTNLTATPLGLYDIDGSHVVVGAMGGIAVLDPDMTSADVLSVYASSGEAVTGVAAAPANTVAPVASGDTEIGDTVSVTTGTWTGFPTPVLTYQWQVSDGENWEDIDGATSNELVLTEALYGEDVRCVVTGTNVVNTDSANSNPLGPVSGTAPSNDEAPVASGDDLTVGSIVSVTTGEWTANPAPVFTYQWQVSDGEGGWEDIEGATSNELELIADFVGEDVRCVVTATNIVGDASEPSNSLGPVTSAE